MARNQLRFPDVTEESTRPIVPIISPGESHLASSQTDIMRIPQGSCEPTHADPPLEPLSEYPSHARQPDQHPLGYKLLKYDHIEAPRLTHYLFRFPAKFHPRVVHSLIQQYTVPGQTILDPFCGSGTLLVAAAVDGRNAIGSDVDPVATFVSKAKTHRYRPSHLRHSWEAIRTGLTLISRSPTEYYDRRFRDISVRSYTLTVSRENLPIPEIPNLMHWFRRYVIVDLARMSSYIRTVEIPETHRQFFILMFASIIRNASNADPVPVSGLEVTAHMRAKEEAGRLVNPFALFERATLKGLDAMEAYSLATTSKTQVSVLKCDVGSLASRVRRPVHTVITSPPYLNAVDYYRRHQLEMYWLGFTKNHSERLKIRRQYIGRPNIGVRDPVIQRSKELGRISMYWYQKMVRKSQQRATAFLHYIISMKDAVSNIASTVSTGGTVIFVMGHSNWDGHELPTSDMLLEMCDTNFDVIERLWYPLRNRYMSFSRHNKASIGEEHVLILMRRAK